MMHFSKKKPMVGIHGLNERTQGRIIKYKLYHKKKKMLERGEAL